MKAKHFKKLRLKLKDESFLYTKLREWADVEKELDTFKAFKCDAFFVGETNAELNWVTYKNRLAKCKRKIEFFKTKLELLKLENKLIKVAKKYGVHAVIFVEPGDIHCTNNGIEKYIERSFIVGNDMIYLGIYKDLELLVISFFHELGHIVKSKGEKYNSEEEAWKIGIELAKEERLEFSENALNWAKTQLSTYQIK